jgi:hypothetical protein
LCKRTNYHFRDYLVTARWSVSLTNGAHLTGWEMQVWIICHSRFTMLYWKHSLTDKVVKLLLSFQYHRAEYVRSLFSWYINSHKCTECIHRLEYNQGICQQQILLPPHREVDSKFCTRLNALKFPSNFTINKKKLLLETLLMIKFTYMSFHINPSGVSYISAADNLLFYVSNKAFSWSHRNISNVWYCVRAPGRIAKCSWRAISNIIKQKFFSHLLITEVESTQVYHVMILWIFKFGENWAEIPCFHDGEYSDGDNRFMLTCSSVGEYQHCV